MRESSAPLRDSPLSRYLLAVYVLLVAYATLYPLAGWRDPGGSAFAFLGAPWPRYVTAFDVAANFFGYVPYGLLCALALRPRLPPPAAALVALLSGNGAFHRAGGRAELPAGAHPVESRLVANVAGAACGAIAGAWLAPRLLAGGPLSRLRDAALTPGPAADLALALLGLWLFAQLNPATQLFGAGDLRELIAAPAIPGERHPPELFVTVEAAIASANLVAVALIASAVIRPQAPVLRLIAGLLVVALGVKSLALAILMRDEHALAWLTPGAQQGLAAGAVIALLALRLPRTARLVLAAMLLMAATVLVNLAPPNPYFAETLKVWAQGHFLNFNGLTRLVSAAWPFAALGYLVYPRHGDAPRAAPVKSRPMSYYERHVFFCCNQREGDERPCCNGKGASAMRDYAKQRVKELGLAQEGKPAASCASTRPAAWTAARKVPASSSIRRRSGTPTSTAPTSTKSSRSTCGTAASSSGCESNCVAPTRRELIAGPAGKIECAVDEPESALFAWRGAGRASASAARRHAGQQGRADAGARLR